MEARVIVALALITGCHAPAAAPPAPPVAIAGVDAAPPPAPPPDAPQPLDRDPPALVARELALLAQVADAVAAEGTCATRAVALDALDAAPVVAARRAMLAAGLGPARDAALDAEHARLTALVDRIAHDGEPCAGDAVFERALDHALAP